MKNTLIVIGILLGATLLGSTTLSIPRTSAAGETHTFECGSDVPPSGPYLDRSEGILYEYSCLTGTLAPVSASQLDCIVAGQASDPIPVAGVCALLKKESNTEFATRFQVADVHFDPYVRWEIYNEHDRLVPMDNNEEEMLVLGAVAFWQYYGNYPQTCGSQIDAWAKIYLSDGHWGPHNEVSVCR